MLEKFGLPAKPSIRGGSWVVDASHCQGCSSQFTFINRKHHCRRCGGLFCNSCTQQRMILRGQGDSPVRICDPCKKLEDAARFELRYGHKNRATKGSSKEISKNEEVHSTKINEEEVLNQILGTNGKKPKLSENGLDMVSDLPQITTNVSGSYVHEESSTSANAARNGVLNASGSSSPEELRQQAMEEKKKYKILKGEGKPEEALQAFKRGKELERQAQALEITLRKNRRMASKASSSSGVTDTKETDDSEDLSNKRKFPSRRGSDDKDDLAAELKGLGWSDADLHDAAKKPANLSLEGELANLIGEFPRKSSQGSGTGGIDKTQVIAHKKQALLFKREGKLAEAKEELKKAKVLEKQIEEQELLGEAEESDDELSTLIKSMDDDKQDDLLLDRAFNPGINLDHLLGAPDDFAFDGNFEVTDDDLNDPDLASALKSFGWTEEDDEHEDDPVMQPLDLEALKGQVLTLKREALTQKRAGNVSEAMALLRKAKLLEKDLEGMQSDTQSSVSKSTKTSESQSNEKLSVTRTDDETSYSKIPAKNKLVIQRELLGIKKKALSLRREGKIEEAEEELKKGKVLEQQLEELENAPKRPVAASVAKRRMETGHRIDDESGTLDLGEDKVDSEVTDQDMNDPALLSVLKNLGWQDEDVSVIASSEISEQISSQVTSDNGSLFIPPKTLKSKSEIQRELLSIKRKSLALRRQGKTEEAEEELKRAKILEDQLADIEASNTSSVLVESLDFGSLVPQKKSNSSPTVNLLKSDEDAPSSMNDRSPKDEVISTKKVSVEDSGNETETRTASLASSMSLPQVVGIESQSVTKEDLSVEKNPAVGVFSSFQADHSFNGVDAFFGSEELAHRQSLDTCGHSSVNAPTHQINVEENISRDDENSSRMVSSSKMIHKNETTVTVTSISAMPELGMSQGIDIRKNEILAHKRRAVALKREGKLAEAKEELRQAKLLEKSMEGSHQAEEGSRTAPASTSASDRAPVILERKTHQPQKPVSSRDRFKLQQESLAHKRNALKLRREGKLEESDAEFELAKVLESQLEEISNEGSSAKVGASDDVFVEDLLDPQLVSSLKSIGWGDADLVTQPSTKSESSVTVNKDGKSSPEKGQLEEQIKNEKIRAINFKRAGKQAEALEALRAAKRLEKRLESLS